MFQSPALITIATWAYMAGMWTCQNGSYSDYEGTYPTFREFGPFQTLREAYDYAVPPESEGQW